MIKINEFIFNGKSSKDMGVFITSLKDNTNIISRNIILGDKNKYRPRENHFGSLYSENYSFTLGISKNACNNDHDYEFSSDDIRKINAWLTSPQFPKEFKFINNSYFNEDISFNVIITNITSNDNTSIPNELIYSVQCDSPYGYSEEKNYHIDSISIVSKKLIINNTSDEQEMYIYPLIKIQPLDHSNITIKNITDGNKSITINSLKNDDYYIDSQRMMIHDITGELISFDDMGITDVDQIYFPRLCYGENELEFIGNASIDITFKEPRKVGAFYGY